MVSKLTVLKADLDKNHRDYLLSHFKVCTLAFNATLSFRLGEDSQYFVFKQMGALSDGSMAPEYQYVTSPKESIRSLIDGGEVYTKNPLPVKILEADMMVYLEQRNHLKGLKHDTIRNSILKASKMHRAAKDRHTHNGIPMHFTKNPDLPYAFDFIDKIRLFSAEHCKIKLFHDDEAGTFLNFTNNIQVHIELDAMDKVRGDEIELDIKCIDVYSEETKGKIDYRFKILLEANV